MAERVRPVPDAPSETPATPVKPVSEEPEHKPAPAPTKPKPPKGQYVIQIPRDQIFRVPSPATAERFKSYTRRASTRRRPSCFRLLLWLFFSALVVLLVGTVAGVVLYLVFQPRFPVYSIDHLSITGLNVSTGNLSLSPEITATVRAENPNKKISVDYRSGGAVAVSYSGVELCSGPWPVSYQAPRNMTAFQMVLNGSGVRLSKAMRGALQAEQQRGEVPLEVGINVPVRVKVGAAWSWTIDVKVGCDVKVDKLTSESRIVSRTCRVELDV